MFDGARAEKQHPRLSVCAAIEHSEAWALATVVVVVDKRHDGLVVYVPDAPPTDVV